MSFWHLCFKNKKVVYKKVSEKSKVVIEKKSLKIFKIWLRLLEILEPYQEILT